MTVGGYGMYGVNSYSNMYGASSVFNYNAAQTNAQAMLSLYTQSNTTVSALKKDTANFLTRYTNHMNGMSQSASKLMDGGINKILFDGDGNTSEESIANAVAAVRDMVTKYNDTLDFLNANGERGSGVIDQIGRMAADPAAEYKLELVGVTVNDDGTLALDEEALTASLSDENLLQVRLVADSIGDFNGLAGGVQKDAVAGLNTPAGKLVNYDIANMQEIRNSNPINQMYQEMRGGGVYYLNNMAAGLMMNMLV